MSGKGFEDGSKDQFDELLTGIENLGHQVTLLKNIKQPTMPVYPSIETPNPGDTPDDPLEGQVAAAVDDSLLWYYVNGQWRKAGAGITWKNLTLQSPWSNVGSPYHVAQYGFDGAGLRFRGAVTGGATGNILGYLPLADRPTADEQYVISIGQTTACTLYVRESDGAVIPHF